MELVAILPLCVVVGVVVWQLVLAGGAAWGVGSAARAAARARAVGLDPAAAARAALPAGLERRLRVQERADGGVEVTVRVPSVLRGAISPGAVSATARFEPQVR